jgi:hypothetical protein
MKNNLTKKTANFITVRPGTQQDRYGTRNGVLLLITQPRLQC